MSEYITYEYYDDASEITYTEQREEIVRCRDCIWYIDDPDMYTSRPFCDYMDGIHFKPNDFCSYGKRKDNSE